MKRAVTQQSNSQRIDRVMPYILAHLQDDLDLQQLAEIACLSPFHFHRLYHAVAGETVAATLARLRLHGAAIALVKTERPLTSISRRAGYGSISAFSRAFRKSYGAAPTFSRQSAQHRR